MFENEKEPRTRTIEGKPGEQNPDCAFFPPDNEQNNTVNARLFAWPARVLPPPFIFSRREEM